MSRVSLCLLVAGMFALGGGLVGQDKKEEPGKAKAQQLPQGWGKANLGLTDEQKTKIYALDGKFDAEIEALSKKIADLKAKKHDDQIAVLTPEQKKKLEDYFKSKAK